MLGVLGGMGPAATVDFLDKIVRLTPAGRDQDHLPTLVWSWPAIPDRTAAILGLGPSPLPALIEGLARLEAGGARVIAIPCNSSHHWYPELQARASVPILHIADAALAALDRPPFHGGPVAVLATRGTLASGFYQRKLAASGRLWILPEEGTQRLVDAAIRGIKEGAPAPAAGALARVYRALAEDGAGAAILACTELPLAAALLPPPGFQILDSNLELARASVAHALAAPWHREPGAGPWIDT